MDLKRKKEINDYLVIQLKAYVEAILNKYSLFMGNYNVNRIKNTNLDDVIQITNFDSINAYVYEHKIYMPLSADKVLNKVSKLPGSGVYKNHKSYNDDTLLVNNNNFIDYIMHVFITGSDLQKYYEELLLHETMHFCGSGGATALKEGINEYLTRKLALEYSFVTNGCGYPKEIDIIISLEELFGEDTICEIAFINNEYSIIDFLENKLGKEAALLYKLLSNEMQNEFEEKYYSKMDNFDGIKGIIKKVTNYSNIDYSSAKNLISQYKEDNLNNKKHR